jgi:hypothetical protein
MTQKGSQKVSLIIFQKVFFKRISKSTNKFNFCFLLFAQKPPYSMQEESNKSGRPVLLIYLILFFQLR